MFLSAVFGTDYVPNGLVFTFSAPNQEQCDYISLLNDDALECDHSFTISVESTTPDISASGFQNITILDTDSELYV